MKTGIYVGADSGGTRTNVEILVVDELGNRRSSSYEVSDSLSGVLAPGLIRGVLSRILAPLDMRLDDMAADGLECYVWVSSAGFSPWTRDEYASCLVDLIPSVAGGRVSSVGVANDAVSLLLGSRADGIVIAGTGSNVLVKSKDGHLYQAGGRDWVACDYGSGFWIGIRAIRQAYQDFEAGIDSVVLQRLRQVYGIRPDDDRGLVAKMRDLAIGDENMKKEIARIAASICAAAERGDRGAQDLVKSEAEELADVMAGALRRRFTMEELVAGIRVVQCGSVLGNEFYRSSFESQLHIRLLSGIEHKASVDWQRVSTGGASAIQLAMDLAESSNSFMKLDVAFRPSIVTA